MFVPTKDIVYTLITLNNGFTKICKIDVIKYIGSSIYYRIVGKKIAAIGKNAQ